MLKKLTFVLDVDPEYLDRLKITGEYTILSKSKYYKKKSIIILNTFIGKWCLKF